MQHRRLRLRSASQGSAPAPAAQRHSTATKENQEHPTRVRTGNSVSPLDNTYHGGPRTILKSPPIVNGPAHKNLLSRAFEAHRLRGRHETRRCSFRGVYILQTRRLRLFRRRGGTSPRFSTAVESRKG